MPLKPHVDEPPTLNLTPMIDIIFQLIIFFMVGSRFSEYDERQIGLELPQVSQAGTLSPAPRKRVINVFQDGHITLDDQTITLDELVTRLKDAQAQYAELGVLVRGDADGRFQSVAQVLNACKLAGIRDLGVSVEVASRATKTR